MKARAAASLSLCACLLAPQVLVARAADGPRLDPVRVGEPSAERAAPEPPVRAYAIDGKRFYYGGREFIAEEFDNPRPSSEVAKQRLQRLLDSGELLVAPLDDSEREPIRARVSIDGRPIGAP